MRSLRLAGDFLWRDQDALRFLRAAADASAKLMKLCEAEAVGMLDDHHGGVRNVDADFDYSGGDQDLDFVAAKLLHDGIFFVIFQAAVKQAKA